MEEQTDKLSMGIETNINEVQGLADLLGKTSISTPNENIPVQCSSSASVEINLSRKEEDSRNSLDFNNTKKKLNNETPEASINMPSTTRGVGRGTLDLEKLLTRHTGNDNAESIEPRNVPANNVPEKIVFCIDICEDPGCTPFKRSDGSKFHTLFMIRKVVDMFMAIKSQLRESHEFALVMLLPDRAVWIRDFTKDHRDISSDVDSLDEAVPSEMFDLSSVFDILRDQIDVPRADDPCSLYSIRIIFLYNRSHCIPTFLSGRESFEYFSSSDYFTFDAIYIHEEPTEMNKCEEIFHALCDLDVKGWSYIFDNQRNATKLHSDLAKLMSHPFQRPLQTSASYKVPEAGLKGLFTN